MIKNLTWSNMLTSSKRTRLYIIEKGNNTTQETNIYVCNAQEIKHVAQVLWSKPQALFEFCGKGKEAQRHQSEEKTVEKYSCLICTIHNSFLSFFFLQTKTV